MAVPYHTEQDWKPVVLTDMKFFKRMDKDIVAVTRPNFSGRKFFLMFFDQELQESLCEKYGGEDYCWIVNARRLTEPEYHPLYWSSLRIRDINTNRIVLALRNRYQINGRRIY